MKNIIEQRCWEPNRANETDHGLALTFVELSDALAGFGFHQSSTIREIWDERPYRRFLIPWNGRWIAACPWHLREGKVPGWQNLRD